MRSQLDDSVTGSGGTIGEDLGTLPVIAFEDVATQPIDISAWILGEGESS